MYSKIPYAKPSITELEVRYATDAATNGWGDQCYAYIAQFETKFKDHLGVRFAIATSSGTGALHMGMAALDIRSGDEVILADTNWIATVSPVVALGAKPVFVDILMDSWCIDPAKVEAAITSKTKAIIAVHLYGNCCAMKELLAIGEKYGIPIIEDAAEAVGSVYFDRRAGSMGKFGAFSFHGTKTITTGEGGMFVTNDPALYERVLTLSNHGRSRLETRQFWPTEVGYKYKLSNVQAAIGCAQMERIDELIARKKDILKAYRGRLLHMPGVSMNLEPPCTVNGAWMPTVFCSTIIDFKRENLIAALKLENIDARVVFWPLSGLEIFDSSEPNLNSRAFSERAINLPSFHDITDEEIDRVTSVFINFINKKYV